MRMKREILNFTGIQRFSARIERYSIIPSDKQVTTCLSDIQNSDGKYIMDHLWIRTKLQVFPGTTRNIGRVVSFYASSTMYFYGGETSENGSYALWISSPLYVAGRFVDTTNDPFKRALHYQLRKHHDQFVIAKIKDGSYSFYTENINGQERWKRKAIRYFNSEFSAQHTNRGLKHPKENHVFQILMYDNHLYFAVRSTQQFRYDTSSYDSKILS